MSTFNRRYTEVPVNVRPDVPHYVNNALGEIDRDMATQVLRLDGAVEIVKEKLSGKDLLYTDNPRVPDMGDPDAFRVQNKDGGIPFRVEDDSTWVGNTEVVPDDEHFRIKSRNDRLLLDIDPVSGRVYIPLLETDNAQRPGAGTGTGAAVSRVVLALGAGQSNMAGKALPMGAGLDALDPLVQMWHWGTKELTAATVPLSGPTASPTGYGLLNEIARQTLLSEPEGTAVVVLNSAVGNTSLVGESTSGTWQHDYAGTVPRLYAQMVTEIPKVLAAIKTLHGITPEVRFYWHQGEADAGATATYTTKFTALVADLRARLNLPNMPVVLGGMVPEYIVANPNRAAIRAAHVQIPATVPRSAYVDGVPNGGGSASVTDVVHYHRAGAEALGAAMYGATRRAVVNKPGSVPVPPPAVRATLGGGTLAVWWEEPLCAVTGYTAEYSTDTGITWTVIPRPLALEPSARAAVSGAAVQVRVSTVNAVGTSAASTPVTATLGA